ncbi:MAG: pitrilysin family protein [Geminicoccaceae bacterium]|nr:pitrilysin family protein [Geminicoccaceae bacterium]
MPEAGAMATGLNLAAEAGAPMGMFHPQTFTLDNGMQVVVIENHRAPVVSHWVWYKVGTADSPPGKSGLPHFLEHLMFKGTEAIAPGEFSKIVARHGGNDNAMTSSDFTAYFQNIARDRLAMVMEMEADRMANLRLDAAHVLAERDVILEERSSRVDNQPGAMLHEQLDAAQFLNHPYRLPIIGWHHEIASYTREDALAFYDLWYAPNNAILVVAGDITMDELRPLAERTYGRVAPRPTPERRRLVEPPQLAERRIELAHERVEQPSLVRSYLAPSHATAADGRAHALEVLAELFGGGGTSRLYRAIVVDQALASGIGAYYRGTSLDQTAFRIYGSPRGEVDLDRLEKALDAEIERLVEDGVTEAEVERVKARLIAESVYARDSLTTAVRVFGSALTTGSTIEDVESWPASIAAVTRPAVEAAARELFDRGRSVTGRLTPARNGNGKRPAGDAATADAATAAAATG